MASQLISASEFCAHHQIEISFLQSLNEYGLIKIATAESNSYLHPDDVTLIEKLVRLHYDLHINLEGIDAIHHLLQRMENMQNEMLQLQNRLRLYEQA
jgi:hypothetical protein